MGGGGLVFGVRGRGHVLLNSSEKLCEFDGDGMWQVWISKAGLFYDTHCISRVACQLSCTYFVFRPCLKWR